MQQIQQKKLEIAIQPLVLQINNHRAFQAITSIASLRKFSEMHVFAVWDFMSLVKALQRNLTCLEKLWVPVENHLGCHLINEIIAAEESDKTADDRYLSHFDMYLEAMQQCGANIQPISAFVRNAKYKIPLERLLTQSYIPLTAKQFVMDTFTVIDKEPHQVATSFAYARENITEGMFNAILENIATKNNTTAIDKFVYYFQRHIELDGGQHSEDSKRLVMSLCGTDATKWQEATAVALFSLTSRIKLLDGIYDSITKSNDYC